MDEGFGIARSEEMSCHQFYRQQNVRIKKITVQQDPWSSLKAYTTARIALGKTGAALPLKALLEFRLAHAHARDAVYSQINSVLFIQALEALRIPYFYLQSRANTRHKYLQRPDFGRQLHADSHKQLVLFESGAMILPSRLPTDFPPLLLMTMPFR